MFRIAPRCSEDHIRRIAASGKLPTWRRHRRFSNEGVCGRESRKHGLPRKHRRCRSIRLASRQAGEGRCRSDSAPPLCPRGLCPGTPSNERGCPHSEDRPPCRTKRRERWRSVRRAPRIRLAQGASQARKRDAHERPLDGKYEKKPSPPLPARPGQRLAHERRQKCIVYNRHDSPLSWPDEPQPHYSA